MNALVLVELLTPDPAATTARVALRERLGFDTLHRLRRLTCLELALPDSASSHDHMVDLLENTIVLANPNKESAILADGEAGIAVAAPSALVWDLMHDGVDAGLAKRVARVCPPFEGVTVRRAALWTPAWSDDPSKAEAEDRIRRAALGTPETPGLLSNPHANGCVIVTDDVKPGDVSRRLSAAAPA